ncbi:MAG TPA: hypothetical protein VFB80_23510 [Pirellulaceae bacterium]|nr:hypothetical protein [Pirellulaceae bacterium]
MNGVALLVALSALGIDHTWRSTQEGQVEYVLQVEPVFLQALIDGQEIKSELPPAMQRADRICIRIGSSSLKQLDRVAPDWPDLRQPAERQATERAIEVPPAIYADAAGQAYKSYEVTHGWTPAGDEESQYLLQIDPTLVKSLREGDELYAAILPEAGEVRSFVITAGREDLPRQSAKPAVAVAQLQTRGAGEASADPTLTDLTQPEAGSVYGDGQASVTRPPPGASAPLRSGMRPGWNISDAQDAGNQTAIPYAAGQSPATTLQPPDTSLLDVPPFDHEQFSGRTTSGGTRAGTTAAGSGAAAVKNTAPRHPSQQPATSSRPNVRGQDRRIAQENDWQVEEPEARLASRTTAPPSSMIDDSPRRGTTTRSAESAADKEPQFPVLPFTLSLFALFLSLGGNLYLAWTAAEFYSRYKLAVERLRSAAR